MVGCIDGGSDNAQSRIFVVRWSLKIDGLTATWMQSEKTECRECRRMSEERAVDVVERLQVESRELAACVETHPIVARHEGPPTGAHEG
jgi:hypothetical protein